MLTLLILSLGFPLQSGSASACAKSAFIESGNVFVQLTDNSRRQITASGKDDQVTLSNDGRLLVFVRKWKVATIGAEKFTTESEIWSASCAEGWIPKALVTELPGMERAGKLPLSSPRLSPNSDRAYFLFDQWAGTSAGLFYYDFSKRKVSFFAGAMRYWVIPYGSRAGNLILKQNPLLVGGGRLEIFYLFDRDAREIGIVGLKEEAVANLLMEAQPERQNRE